MESASHYKLQWYPLLLWLGRMSFTARQHPDHPQGTAVQHLICFRASLNEAGDYYNLVLSLSSFQVFCMKVFWFCSALLYSLIFLYCFKNAIKVCSIPIVARRGVNGSPVVDSAEQKLASPSNTSAVRIPWECGAQMECLQLLCRIQGADLWSEALDMLSGGVPLLGKFSKKQSAKWHLVHYGTNLILQRWFTEA